MRLLSALVCLLSLSIASAQSLDPTLFTAEMAGRETDFEDTAKPPIEYPVSFDESDFQTKPWMRDFEWVIVVNKSDSGADRQSLRVYRNQRLITAEEVINGAIEGFGYDKVAKFVQDLPRRMWAPSVFKISTGREEFEPKGAHGSSRDSYTITPAGFFVPQYFTPIHKSEAYSSKSCGMGREPVLREDPYTGQRYYAYKKGGRCVMMEDVIFFNGSIALHRAIAGTEPRLGNRASGGCIRLPGALAAYLYTNLSQARYGPMPKIYIDGSVEKASDGSVIKVPDNTSTWGRLEARSALIIVQDKYVEGRTPPGMEQPPADKPPRKKRKKQRSSNNQQQEQDGYYGQGGYGQGGYSQPDPYRRNQRSSNRPRNPFFWWWR